MIPNRLLSPALLGITFLISLKCNALDGKSLSLPQIDVTNNNGMVVVDTWRICGPFVLSKSQDYTWYSPNLESESLGHDYLEQIGGKESPLSLGSPSTNIPVNFFNDVKNQVKGEDGVPPPYKPFVDQIQKFPSADVSSQTLYWNFPKRFSITYGAASLVAQTERDVVFVASSNSPLKIWLNGEVISQPPYGSVGRNWSDYYIGRVHLRAGINSLLIKMFTFPERNDFSFRIGTRAQVDQFIDQNASYLDLMNQVIVPTGTPLSLSENLLYLASESHSSSTVSIVGSHGKVLRSDKANLMKVHSIPTTGIEDGVYDLHIKIGKRNLTETFYVGNVNDLLARYKPICSHKETEPGHLNPCVVLKPILDRMTDQQMTERLDKEKPLLLLISQLVWAEQSETADSPFQETERHVYLETYQSAIDQTQQYYYVHLPSNYSRGSTVPLVVICPYNHHHKAFLVGPTNTLAPVLQQYASYADKYGFAFVVPYARGVGMSNPLGLKDVLEVVKDVQKKYRINPAKLYLNGDCAGGRGALLFAEHFPYRFAAISTVNAATGSQFVDYGDDDDDSADDSIDDGLLSHVGNLAHIPILLVHGNLFPHSPTRQAYGFRERCKRNGFAPEIDILPGDGTFGERDPIQVSFEFFKDKSLAAAYSGKEDDDVFAQRSSQPKTEDKPSDQQLIPR